MFRFDHDVSLQGVGVPPLRDEPQVCELTPIERVAAPAIYWSRSRGMRGPASVGPQEPDE